MSLFPLGLLSQGGGAGGAPAYELISTTTLGSDTANVTLSSIPSTYKHLKFVISGRSNTASTGFSNVFAQINGGTGSSYWFSYLEVSGGSYTNQRSATVQTSGKMGYTQNNSHTAGYFSGHDLEILDYTSTNKYKTARFQSRTDSIDTATAYMSYGSFVFLGTAAVSSINFFLSSGSWLTGSRFSVYGITG